MKKLLIFIPIVIVIIACYTFYSCKPTTNAPEKIITQTLVAQIDSLTACKNKLLAAAENGKADEKQLQQLFLQLRLEYKKIEWATEYFDPATSRFFNGPPVQEIEIASGQVFAPAGLQVIEGYLFPKYNISQKNELINQLKLLQNGCSKYKSRFANIAIFNWQVFDATKQEVFRILTLGIAGFDNPLTLKASDESATSLESIKTVLAHYEDKSGDENLPNEIEAAVKYLKANTDFNAFNRAAFITRYGNPITTSIANLEEKLHFKEITYNRLLKKNAKTLFDKDAYNSNAYVPGDSSTYTTSKKIALGNALFADPILSGNGKRSCQSCHNPAMAFTDGLVKNTIIDGNKPIRRNTPTLINAALQASQFYDLRAATLEDQALSVVQNKDEMHGSMKNAAIRLWQNETYRKMFADAFPQKDRKDIDTLEVMNAIGSYVRSLTALNSRFDEYMRGNKSAMNAGEISGFNIFMGKARCGTCHYMPLFNGSFPPRYTLIESEVIGVPKTVNGKVIDDDMGRYDILKTDAFKHAFKITTVRNAARTAPYMHNGVFKTLDEVMDFYNKGGGTGQGYKVDNQTLATDELHLSKKETDEVIAFIKSLDSK